LDKSFENCILSQVGLNVNIYSPQHQANVQNI